MLKLSLIETTIYLLLCLLTFVESDSLVRHSHKEEVQLHIRSKRSSDDSSVVDMAVVPQSLEDEDDEDDDDGDDEPKPVAGTSGGDMIGMKMSDKVDPELWPNGIVPYVMQAFEFSEDEEEMFQEAVDTFNSKTCLKWKLRNNEPSYVVVRKLGGCASYVGRNGPQESQDLSLASGCFTLGTILHEMMHAVGFDHEQSRYDRDDFVKIIWENIKKNSIDNFDKNTKAETIAGLKQDTMAAPYDYKSIMHYGKNYFSKNGGDTIVPYSRDVKNKIGQRNTFSKYDLYEINRLYKCGTQPPLSPSLFTPPSKTETLHALPITCSFDTRSECGFEQPYTEILDWERVKGATTKWYRKTGPLSDPVSEDGYYLLMTSKSVLANPGDRAIFQSPVFDPNGAVCVRFQYNMNGATMGSLRLDTLYGESKKVLESEVWMEAVDTQTTDWFTAEVDVYSDLDQLRVQWVGTVGAGQLSDIAIDEIRIENGKCNAWIQPVVPNQSTGGGTIEKVGEVDNNIVWPSPEQVSVAGGGEEGNSGVGPTASLPFFCDFENSDCDIINEGNPDVLFVNRRKAFAAMAEKSKGNHQTAMIESPSFDDYGISCATFDVQIYRKTTKLNFYYEKEDGAREILWKESGPVYDFKNEKVQFEMRGQSRVGFEVTFRKNKGIVRIDNLEVTLGECEREEGYGPGPDAGAAVDLPIQCNFDNRDLCGFVQDENDDFDWTRRSGKTPSRGTGPSHGYSVNMMNQQRRGPRRKRWAKRKSGKGRKFGGFARNKKKSNRMENTESSLSESSEKGGEGGGKRKKVFGGFGKKKSDKKENTDLSTEVSREISEEAAGREGIRKKAFGGGAKFDYGRRRGGGRRGRGGRERGGGGRGARPKDHYIYTEASDQSEHDYARISTPTFQSLVGFVCVKFAYHMKGRDIGTLKVLRWSEHDGQTLEIFKRSGATDVRGWYMAKGSVVLSSRTNAKIIFEGIIGDGSKGDIAVDEIEITEGFCEEK